MMEAHLCNVMRKRSRRGQLEEVEYEDLNRAKNVCSQMPECIGVLNIKCTYQKYKLCQKFALPKLPSIIKSYVGDCVLRKIDGTVILLA